MTVGLTIIWVGLVAAWLALLILLQRSFRKDERTWPRFALAFVKLFVGTAVAYLIVGAPLPLPYWFSFTFAALYAALFGDAAADLLFLIVKHVGKKLDVSHVQLALSVACTAIYLLFGTLNMQTVSANHIHIESDKLTRPYTFVFVSDLHVGSAQSLQTTEDTIKRIAAEGADFIVLGGDIVDVNTTREEMEHTFSLFGAIEAPTFYIYGNHDRQLERNKQERTFTAEELEAAIRTHGIQILQDEWVSFADDLVVFGREDFSMDTRKEITEIPPRPNDAFVLLVDHSPYITQDIIQSGADLQMSGHTHAGQLFPLQAIYRLAGFDAYGFFRHGETEVYVSSGAAGWGYPFRTEAGCHYEVVELIPHAMES